MAPRLRAEGDGVMLLSPIIILLMLEGCPTVGVRNSNERVFSSFRFSQYSTILAMGAEHNVNRSGPSTEP